MRYTEKKVAELVADVEKAFTAHLAKAEEMSLAKSEDGEKDHEDKHEDKEPKHEEKHADGEKHHEEKHDEKESEKDSDHEGHDYDEEDMAHMEKMYRSMSKGELKAHHNCIQKCMGSDSMAKAEIEKENPGKTPGAKSPASEAHGEKLNKADGCGGEMSPNPPKDVPGAKSPASKEQDNLSKEMAKTETGKVEPCEPGKTPGAKSPASKAGGVQMEKSENQEIELLKSELEAEKASKDELKKNFDAVQEFLGKLARKVAPPAKAITSLEVVAKSELPNEDKKLSKGEIHEILKAKSGEPMLRKSDRDAINNYYLTGQVNVNSISHLLK